MDFLSSREKDPLSAKYSTFPGWHSAHIYQRNPSTAAYLQLPSKYNSPTGEPITWMTSGTRTSQDIHEISTPKFPSQCMLSHRELTDYIGKVRREKQRSNKGRYKEPREEWENTWPINCRGRRENCEANSQYANCYHNTLSTKTSDFEVGEWRSSECASGIEKVLGYAETNEKFQPTILTSDKTDPGNREREQWRKWSTWNSRNTERIFPIASFRQPPSYTPPPAYSSPKHGDNLAGIPKVTAQESMEQTFKSRKGNSTDSTGTRGIPSANTGHYLQKNNQTQSYCRDLTGGQHCPEALNTASVMQYTTTRTKASSPPTQLQYRESSEMTHPDISLRKQTKLPRRKGGETVFCLVSRRGEVSGLSSSPEEPLKSHVLPLLTESKPDDVTITPEQTDSPQFNDDSRPNQDEAVIHGSFMLGEYGNTPLDHTEEDQRSSSIQDFGNVLKPNQCYVQKNDSQSCCLTMQTNGHEKPCREIISFPLWKEPKYQHHLTRQRNEQSQGINEESEVTNNESPEDGQKSLVVIDATCVVVKVELVLLPEKEHVQYVCLTEESPLSSTREEIEQNTSVISSLESPENNTLGKGEERILGLPHEYPRTGLQTYDMVDPIKEFEESPSAAETDEVLENELTVGEPWSGTTLENNEGLEETLNIMREGNQTTAKEPEATLEDFVALTNAKSSSEVSGEQTEKTTVETTNLENGPTLEDSVVEHRAQKDDEDHQKHILPKEENLSHERDDRRELVLDSSKPLLKKSAVKEIDQGVDKAALPSIVGFSTLRRSSSSPHLSFTSASNRLDGSHTENEPLLLPSSTNKKGIQYSSLTSLSSTPVSVAFEHSPLSKNANVLLCTSSAPDHKQKIQHAKSLWDAVSRIRKHTAPDSEMEEEEALEFGEQTEGEDTDLLYQRLNTEQE